jgi:hypothetical protein
MKLALVGGASETRWMLDQSDADEFWTVNWSYNYDWIGRIDRLFEVHPVWLYANVDKKEWRKPKEHWEWLKQHHGYPVYMQRKLDVIPESVEIPLDDIISRYFGNNFVSKTREGTYTPHDIFGSSMDYMMAQALYEGNVDEIELIGIEMGSGTEYRYQRESFAVWTGIALGQGVRVIRAENSTLFRIKKYGWEGGQMIFRQDLENLYKWQQQERAVKLARLQAMEGRMQEVKDDDEALMELAGDYRDMRDDLMITVGWGMCLEHELKDIDLEEVEPEIVNPIKVM